jgi:predicted MFS family arabinose efflux permease
MTHYPPPPAALADDLRRLTASELSTAARMRYVGLLFAASAMTVIMTALLITEPSLPLRTSIAFAVLAAMGLSWSGFASWVLTRKRILLGRHRIVAAYMGVAFSAVFCIGALAVGYATSSRAPVAAAAMGAVMLVVAATMLIRARRRFEQLSRRRAELEQQVEDRQS